VDLKGSRGIIPPYPLKINGYPLSLPSIFGKKECRRRGERREGKKEEEKRDESSLSMYWLDSPLLIIVSVFSMMTMVRS